MIRRSSRRKRRKRTAPFPQTPPETWYDLEFDRDLIAQSVAQQYGILPSDQDELHYGDWLLLVGALTEETPLGRVVQIRREADRKRLAKFSQHEHRIRNEWRSFRAKHQSQIKAPEEFAAGFERMFAKMFG